MNMPLRQPRHQSRGALSSTGPSTEIFTLAKKPNYNFEKNRREQDRKKKKEEKRLRRLENSRSQAEEPASDSPDLDAIPPAE
jgi:hypothetical protein